MRAVGERQDFRALRRQPARLARIAEEGDRVWRTDEDERAVGLQRLQRQVDRIGQARQRHAARAALQPCQRGAAHDPRAGLRGDGAGERQGLAAHGVGAEEKQRLVAAPERRGRGYDRSLVDLGASRRRRGCLRGAAGSPGRIGGQDQRCDAPGSRGAGGARLGDRLRAFAGDGEAAPARLHPVRHRPRHAFGVRGQGRVVGEMLRRVLAHDVDDRRAGLAGVVQVGEAVGEAGAQMQQRQARPAGHARPAVGRAGRHALEQAEHAGHALHPVQRRDEMHLRSARVREADVRASRDEGAHEALGPVHGGGLGCHGRCRWFFRGAGPRPRPVLAVKRSRRFRVKRARLNRSPAPARSSAKAAPWRGSRA